MPLPTFRWHALTCSDPKIDFGQHEHNCKDKDSCPLLPECKLVPHCKTCGQKPPLHDIISKHGNSSTFGPKPQDQPFGQLNLHWPSGSLYNASANLVSPQESAPQQELCHVYPTSLLQNEFRQACISPTGDKIFEPDGKVSKDLEDLPIHLTLTTYKEDNCPEYEAFSYTWAGEHVRDNRPRLCCPVYIGPLWDVLMQTVNCWELLRFARYPHVPRQVWVDAVCINQSSMEEKAHQVAKMGRVYRDSSRVVVYLGPDAVTKPKDFPRRHDLAQFAGGELRPKRFDGAPIDIDINKLFSMRYFQRLWIIQELIVSPRAVIRVGDIDLSIDAEISKKLDSTAGLDLAHTLVPWFRYVARQAFRGRDACEALQLVAKAQCSDSRDRLFGILWLMNPQDILENDVRADYSISNQHVWIGFFAHCLLKLDIFWFLIHAAGPRWWHGAQPLDPWVPSWVPNWRLRETWQRFQRPVMSYKEMAQAASDALRSNSSGTEFIYKFPGELLLTQLVSNPARGGPLSQIPWNKEAVVDAKTGTLINIRVVRLFSISSRPHLRTRVGKYRVFEIDLRGVHWGGERLTPDEFGAKPRLFVVSQKRLDTIIRPLHDHLYIIKTKQDLQFLILRHPDGPFCFSEPRGGLKYFKIRNHQNLVLITVEPYTYLNFTQVKPRPNFGPDALPSSPLRNLAVWQSPAIWAVEDMPRLSTVLDLIGQINRLLVQHVTTDARSADKIHQIFRDDFINWKMVGRGESQLVSKNFDLNEIFPDAKNSDLLKLYWALASKTLCSQVLSDEELETCYKESVNETFKPRVRDGYLELQLGTNEWKRFQHEERFEGASDPPSFNCLQWEWRYKEGATWSKFEGKMPKTVSLLGTQRVIHIRTLLSPVLWVIRQSTHTNVMINWITFLCGVLGIETLAGLRAVLDHPPESLHHFKLRSNAFAVDSDSYNINIV